MEIEYEGLEDLFAPVEDEPIERYGVPFFNHYKEFGTNTIEDIHRWFKFLGCCKAMYQYYDNYINVQLNDKETTEQILNENAKNYIKMKNVKVQLKLYLFINMLKSYTARLNIINEPIQRNDYLLPLTFEINYYTTNFEKLKKIKKYILKGIKKAEYDMLLLVDELNEFLNKYKDSENVNQYTLLTYMNEYSYIKSRYCLYDQIHERYTSETMNIRDKYIDI